MQYGGDFGNGRTGDGGNGGTGERVNGGVGERGSGGAGEWGIELGSGGCNMLIFRREYNRKPCNNGR